LVPPTVIRSVNSTSATPYGNGGTKKSAALTAVPASVAMVIGPDAA